MVQWLGLHTATAGSTGSIPGQGTKIPYAAGMAKNKKTKKLKDVFIYLTQKEGTKCKKE